MALISTDLPNSAQQLTSKLANGLATGAKTSAAKVFTAQQATTAVQSYTKTQNTSALNTIVGNYQWVFDSISTASAQGNTSISITTTKFDYSYVAPLFRSYGYTVEDLPTSTINETDLTVKYDITISWPSVTLAPITGLSPGSFIAIQNSQYSVTFVPQGGLAPYTFSYLGQIPSGWTGSNPGKVNTWTIQGTSETLGGGSLIVTVVDSAGQQFTTTVNWNVTQPAQILADWAATQGQGVILNKPNIYTDAYLGTTQIAFNRASGSLTLTDVSITGNAATVDDGVVTTGSYTNPSWLTLTKDKVGLALVDNTPDSTKLVAYAALSGSAANGVVTTQTYTDPTWLAITKTKVGLAQVDNTSDLNKPVSTAAQAALDLKANLISPTFTGTVNGITAGMVGLGNVTNESKTSMLANTVLTGTTTINQATLAVNGTSATSLVNKDYIDKKFFFSLAVGIY